MVNGIVSLISLSIFSLLVYRKEISVCSFYILQLYHIHWLALAIFWWSLYGFLSRWSCLLLTVRFLLLFQFEFLLFLFLLWLLWPKLPKLCWILLVKVGTLVLFLILGEMLSIFKHNEDNEDNVPCGFLMYSFYCVEVCPFYSCFLESFFNHKWMLNFVKGLLCIYWLLFFSLLMWWITLIDLRILKNPCIPGIKPTWSWCMIFLMCC